MSPLQGILHYLIYTMIILEPHLYYGYFRTPCCFGSLKFIGMVYQVFMLITPFVAKRPDILSI